MTRQLCLKQWHFLPRDPAWLTAVCAALNPLGFFHGNVLWQVTHQNPNLGKGKPQEICEYANCCLL